MDLSTNRIVWINGPWKGRRHDAHLYNEGGLVERLKPNEFVLADKGYTGCPKTITPIRGNHRAMAQEDLDLNRAFSKTRIQVEHAFGKMKIFRILKGPWRGNAKDLGRIFYIIAFIHNLLYC